MPENPFLTEISKGKLTPEERSAVDSQYKKRNAAATTSLAGATGLIGTAMSRRGVNGVANGVGRIGMAASMGRSGVKNGMMSRRGALRAVGTAARKSPALGLAVGSAGAMYGGSVAAQSHAKKAESIKASARRRPVTKAFGNSPDNPYASGLSRKERTKRGGKNLAINVAGAGGSLASLGGGFAVANKVKGRKGLIAGGATALAGSGATMYGQKKLGDRVYPGTKQGAFSRKNVAKAYNPFEEVIKAQQQNKPWSAGKRAAAGGVAGGFVGLSPVGIGIGAGSAAKRGKGAAVGAKAGGRSLLEGGALGTAGKLGGALHSPGLSAAGALAGGLGGLTHGASASIKNSRKKGQIRRGL